MGINMYINANILVYIKSKFLFNRIENSFSEDISVRLLETTYLNDCLIRIENLSTNLSCIIMDDDCSEKEALLEIASIRKTAGNKIPILLISSGNKTSFFSQAINQGVSDIIIKPFNDDFLRERAVKLINANCNRNVEIVSISLFKYIKGELKKAEKGKYPLSLMLTTIQFPDDTKYSQKEILFFLDSYFDCLKGLFWDTDLFIKFDSKFYLGVFPFCDTKNAQIIYNKNAERFEELIDSNIIPSDCKMVFSNVSYPENIDSVANGFKTLMKNIKTDFSDSDLEFYFDEYGVIRL